MFLGTTPIAKRAWPMGSWLLIVVPDQGAPLRVPFAVARRQDIRLDLNVPGPGEIPSGFLPVPAGGFVWQGDRFVVSGMPRDLRCLDDFLLARFPVTCREYAAWLNDLRTRDPGEAAARAPREADGAPSYWPLVEGEGYVVPTAGRPGPAGTRLAGLSLDWEEDWPVLGISWADAAAYARWRSLRDGFLFVLPHEEQWEKAARGTDARPYPWGTEAYDRICNVNSSHDSGPRPVVVDSFPWDESPYGVRGLAGNARDWCLNDPGLAAYSGWRVTRGGSWQNPSPAARGAYRAGAALGTVQPFTTVRLAVAVRIGGTLAPWILSLPGQ